VHGFSYNPGFTGGTGYNFHEINGGDSFLKNHVVRIFFNLHEKVQDSLELKIKQYFMRKVRG